MATRINVCRFCNDWTADPDKLVKYGTRHYAHHACYLDAGKPLEALKAHQIGAFPWRLLHDRGLMAKVEALLAPKAEG